MTYVFAAHMLAAHCVAGSRSINMRCSRAHCASTVVARARIFILIRVLLIMRS